MSADAIDLTRMTVNERLVLMDRLIDTLTPGEEFNPSPGWHEAVLSERVAEEKRGSVMFLSLNELKASLKSGGKCR